MTTDSILCAALTFALLIGGTAAIGTEMVASHRAPAARATACVTLPAVTVTGHRQSAVLVAAAK